jgi:hypothetical protein
LTGGSRWHPPRRRVASGASGVERDRDHITRSAFDLKRQGSAAIDHSQWIVTGRDGFGPSGRDERHRLLDREQSRNRFAAPCRGHD